MNSKSNYKYDNHKLNIKCRNLIKWCILTIILFLGEKKSLFKNKKRKGKLKYLERNYTWNQILRKWCPN